MTKTPLQQATDLLAFCKQFTGPYVYGGGHGPDLSTVKTSDGLDCSSSTSRALFHESLLGSHAAQVSGWFETWGHPGHGRYVTVHANADHVWVEFTIPGKPWQRFDTSPHGCGPYGPRVRACVRPSNGFVIRHPEGL